MRIHTILLHNLNSLACDKPVVIDFQKTPLKDCGLFAITGPTGAGKSSILDALTLALYGKTARDSTENEVMSYGAVACRAEVIFETAAGHCFKVSWARRRAHKKADGALRPTEREFSEYPSKKILATKVGEVDALVQQYVGLSKDQFLQSVLLAQGKFTEFLRAEDGGRALLLEKLTGTAIYRQLSIVCFEKQKSEAQKLEQLQLETNGMTVLSKEEITALLQQQQMAEKEVSLLRTRLERLQQEQLWHQELAERQEKIDALKTRQEQIRHQKAAQAPMYQRWQQHLQMLPLELPLQEWRNLCKRRHQLEKEATEIDRKLQKSHLHLQTLRKSMADKQELLNSAQQKLNEQEPALQEAIRHEKTLAEKQEARQKSANDKKMLENRLLALVKQQEQYQKQLKATQNQHHYITTRLQQAANDPHLDGRAAEAEVQLRKLSALRQEANGVQKEINSTQKQCLGLQGTVDRLRAESDENKRMIASCENWHSNTEPILSHWKFWLGRQEIRLQQQQTALLQEHESNRRHYHALDFFRKYQAQLKPGNPCDLCGSTVHPKALQDLSGVENDIKNTELAFKNIQALEYEVQNRIDKHNQMLLLLRDVMAVEGNALIDEEAAPETQLQYLKELDDEKEAKRTQLATARVLIAGSDLQIQEARQRIQELTTAIQHLEKQLDTLKKDGLKINKWFEEQASIYGEIVEKGKEDAFIASLRQRYQTYQQLLKEAENNTAEQLHQQAFIEKLRTDEAENKEAIAQVQEQLLKLEQDCTHLQAEISKACPDGKTSASSCYHSLRKSVTDSTTAFTDAQQLYNKALYEHTGTQRVLENLWKQLKQQQHQHTDLQQQLQTQLRKGELPENPDDALGWLLSTEERLETARLVAQLDRLENETDTTLQQLETEQQTHLLAAHDVQPPEQLAAQQQLLETHRDQLLKNMGALTQALKDDAEKQQQLAGKLAALQVQQQELARWKALNELIGSGNGNTFSTFAQTLSLDLLLQRANMHLRQLSNRYQLCRKSEPRKELGIMVADYEMGGNIREVSTLSGGETFLVSLGLALGLSEMASQNAPINSLFIDEGFGSLDPDSLQDAINTLENLQSHGKTIGIISHVEQLKDRITTQVQVSKKGDGRSSIAITTI